ncbi:Low-density lipoprotein receptor-related protein 6 [Holothuria leucospilota]|uniref:Low-density lipoprotein receptor-related protein 6 n=1 Tax=Holothuria leucospilota TaxID=206669 RepID=A0A9Q1C5A3_HOLLE|nr:Low-density lipoprotein receptor-related protein 6 [Holothuria leucospilota]
MPPQLVIMAENSTIRIIQRYNEVNFVVKPDGIIDPLAVDYDPRTQYLYYSDRETHIIGRISIEVPDNGSVLHSENILEPFGMRIDVNSRLLYWTDAELGTISVSNLDGEYRNTIIDTDLNKPGAIVTEPFKGYIYFTDWGSDPKIERAEGDGKNRLVLVNSDIVSPRSLTIDLEERALYWIDAVTNNLETINFDGTSRKMLRNLFHETVFSLALDDNAFFCNGYYSPEPENGYIHLFDRDLQTFGYYVRWGFGKYYKGISLRPHRESDAFVPDTCPSADCKGLCLPRPNGHHTCLKGMYCFETRKNPRRNQLFIYMYGVTTCEY